MLLRGWLRSAQRLLCAMTVLQAGLGACGWMPRHAQQRQRVMECCALLLLLLLHGREAPAR
jgi:hypothetical protein